jgi:hypothetical protein
MVGDGSPWGRCSFGPGPWAGGLRGRYHDDGLDDGLDDGHRTDSDRDHDGDVSPHTVTAPPQTVTATSPTTPDASTFIEGMLTDKVSGSSGHSTQSFLQNSYPGAAIDVTGAKCVEAGTTQHYQCTVSYTVSGASDSTQDGGYTLGATGSCDSAGTCQTLEDAVDTASMQ